MTNQDILKLLSRSFETFLQTHSRSNKKLIVLHGEIASDISQRLGNQYNVYSLGFNQGKEKNIQGRYINKKVDITITQNDEPIAGIGVKFVMNNYSQNSNNYFENMLGETANIRSKAIPYFQILIIPNRLPYFDNQGNIEKWEEFTAHNAEKYFTLSTDNTTTMLHSPNKTLIYVVQLPQVDENKVKTRSDYKQSMLQLKQISIGAINPFDQKFEKNVILNDYATFADKIVHHIKSL